MIANYHTHTTKCKHAVGDEEEYVRKALLCGFLELGFSDHVPYPCGDFKSNIRMEIEETKDYVATIQYLQRKYEKQIRILIGYEMEFFPSYFKQCLSNLEKYGYDYLILSQHFVEDEIHGVYVGNETHDVKLLHRYADLLLRGMETGKFAMVGHPDVIQFTGSKREYYAVMKEVCMTAKELKIPLEYNILGKKEGKHYPSESFFAIASEVGNEIIIGIDAHSPEELSDKRAILDAENYVRRLHLPIRKRL